MHHSIHGRLLGRQILESKPLGVVLPAFLLSACGVAPHGDDTGDVQDPIIFGSDDRLEHGAVTDQNWLRLGNSVAAIFNASGVTCAGASCNLATGTFTSAEVAPQTFLPLCSGTRFAGQKQGAGCTAFLVGPDLFATAGHCMSCATSFGTCPAAICSNKRVVFGFTANASGGGEVTNVPSGNVYSCVEAKGIWTDAEDFAVFRVDRVVTDRVPMIANHGSKIEPGNGVLVIGHPDGLPVKYSGNGAVKEDLGTVNFGTSMDAFGGNSGSPIINLAAGVVEGVHVRRPYWHYVPSGGGSCATPTVCNSTTGCSPNFGVSPWAQATRFPWGAAAASVPIHHVFNAAVL
jgi:hypothetical protein